VCTKREGTIFYMDPFDYAFKKKKKKNKKKKKKKKHHSDVVLFHPNRGLGTSPDYWACVITEETPAGRVGNRLFAPREPGEPDLEGYLYGDRIGCKIREAGNRESIFVGLRKRSTCDRPQQAIQM